MKKILALATLISLFATTAAFAADAKRGTFDEPRVDKVLTPVTNSTDSNPAVTSEPAANATQATPVSTGMQAVPVSTGMQAAPAVDASPATPADPTPQPAEKK